MHIGTDAIAATSPAAADSSADAAGPGATADQAGVSAETSDPGARVAGHPADPTRRHVEDGPAISVSAAQMLACAATLSWMLHDSPPWYGERLDLDHAIYVCLASARNQARAPDEA